MAFHHLNVTYLEMAPVWGNTYLTGKSSLRESFFLWLL